MLHIPNPPELVLLKALWAQGDLPARQLHDQCAGDLDWSFSSTRKTLERMASKGLIRINTDVSPAKYIATSSKPIIFARMTRDLFGRVLEVDGPLPSSAFTGSQILSDEELEEFEGLIGTNGKL